MKTLKKNILKDLEKIKENLVLPEAEKKLLKNEIIDNFAIAVAFLMLLYSLKITAEYVKPNIAFIMYKSISIILLTFSIVLFEMAYKKDKGIIALYGLEILLVSLSILFFSYLYNLYNNLFLTIYFVTTFTYYSLKIIVLYKKTIKRYRLQVSDIAQIIKKESQDEKAKTEKEKIIKTVKNRNISKEKKHNFIKNKQKKNSKNQDKRKKQTGKKKEKK